MTARDDHDDHDDETTTATTMMDDGWILSRKPPRTLPAAPT